MAKKCRQMVASYIIRKLWDFDVFFFLRFFGANSNRVFGVIKESTKQTETCFFLALSQKNVYQGSPDPRNSLLIYGMFVYSKHHQVLYGLTPLITDDKLHGGGTDLRSAARSVRLGELAPTVNTYGLGVSPTHYRGPGIPPRYGYIDKEGCIYQWGLN